MLLSSSEIPSGSKILVVGSIFDQVHKLNSIAFDQYHQVIVNGNICFPFDDLKSVSNRIEFLSGLPKNLVYNLGAFDLLFFSRLKKENRGNNIGSWILGRTNVRICSWASGTKLMVVGGGVPQTTSKIDLDGNTELSFASLQNGLPWQAQYSGQLGYVIGNHPLSDKPPEFFNFAARIGTKWNGDKTQIWAQEVGEHGLLRTFELG